MTGFKDIVGQESIISHMKNAIKLNKISHAYIINGEKVWEKDYCQNI